jgi:hypothetical protein
MSNIVYSTSIPNEVMTSYQQYQKAKEKFPSGDYKRNAAWLRFCETCERHNKQPMSIVKELSE